MYANPSGNLLCALARYLLESSKGALTYWPFLGCNMS